MKNALLILLLIAFSAFATLDTLVGSGKHSNTAIHSTGAVTALTDSLYKVNNGTFNDTMDANDTIVAFIVDTLTAGTHYRDGKTLTITGSGICYSDKGSGYRQYGTALTFTGDNAIAHVSGATGSTLGLNQTETWAGLNGSYIMNKGYGRMAFAVAASKQVTITGVADFRVYATGTAWTLGNNAKLTNNMTGNAWARCQDAAANAFSLGTGDTLNGTGGWLLWSDYNGGNLTLGANIVYTGTGAWTFGTNDVGKATTFTIGHAINLGSNALNIISAHSGSPVTWTNTNSNVSCGALTMGASTAAVCTVNAGTGTYAIKSMTSAGYNNNGTFNMSSSTFIDTGAWIFGSNWTLPANTFLLKKVPSASTKTELENKLYYDLEFAGVGAILDTIGDTTKCRNFTVFGGGVNQTLPLIASGNVTISSTNPSELRANRTIGGDLTIAAGASLNTGGDSVTTSFTGAGASVLTANGYALNNVIVDKTANGLTTVGVSRFDTLLIRDGTFTSGDTVYCNVFIDSSTDAVTLAYPLVITKSVLFAAGTALTATSCDLILNGIGVTTTTATLTSFKSLTVTASSTANTSGSNQLAFYSGSGVALTMGLNGVLTTTKNLYFILNATGTATSLPATYTINGHGTLNFYNNNASGTPTITIPALVCSCTVIISSTQNAAVTFSLGGDISTGQDSLLWYASAGTGDMTALTNNHAIRAGKFIVGAYFIYQKGIFDFGSSEITVTEFKPILTNDTATTIDYGSSVWNTDSWTASALWHQTAGTASIHALTCSPVIVNNPGLVLVYPESCYASGSGRKFDLGFGFNF